VHKNLIWSPLSEKDFDQILEYLSINWDIKVVIRFIDITEHLINQISENPKQYPLINKKKRIRRVVLTKHNSLFYRESKNQIDILRIYDTRQDPHKISFK
jgi:plasmid stabilization system protein ParE